MWWLQGFGMAKALRISQSEQHYPDLTRAEDVNHAGKKLVQSVILQVLLRPLQQKPVRKVLKFRVVPQHVIPKKFSICQNVKFLVKSPRLGKRKPNFVIGLTIIKVHIEHLERVTRKFLRKCFTLTIVSMAIVALKIGIL